jgi:uncharacterized protein
MNKPATKPFPWGHTRRFNAYSEHIRKIFGARVQKLSLDAGFSCPNRDGTISTDGCTFCDSNAFNPSYCQPEKSITQQLAEGIEFHKKRYRRSSSYLAYFQAYSNTHAPLAVFKNDMRMRLPVPGVIGLVIGTRPDCVDAEKLDYLARLAESTTSSLNMELNPAIMKTLESINRGHTFEQAHRRWTKRRNRGIKTGAHFIIGLPGETREEILDHAGIIAQLPIDNIKFHQLQILKNTALETDFLENPGKFNLFSLEEYVEFISGYIQLLPPQMVIERFTAEVPPRYRIAPDWGNLRTDQILEMIERKLEEKNAWQGKRYNAQ